MLTGLSGQSRWMKHLWNLRYWLLVNYFKDCAPLQLTICYGGWGGCSPGSGAASRHDHCVVDAKPLKAGIWMNATDQSGNRSNLAKCSTDDP